MKNKFLSLLVGCMLVQTSWSQFLLQAGEPLSVACDTNVAPVVQTALSLFKRDYEAVFSADVEESPSKGTVVVASLQNQTLSNTDISVLEGKKQAFLMQALSNGNLLIVGSDGHGMAYGLMELSRMIGVSPWEWWAAATPKKRAFFELPA